MWNMRSRSNPKLTMVTTVVILCSMKTVSKSRLKARMLEYFREVEATGEPLIVTDHGRETLEVRPVQKRSTAQEVLAAYAAAGSSNLPAPEELMEPLPADEWEALRENDGAP